jgi:HEPN domain-containing protein
MGLEPLFHESEAWPSGRLSLHGVGENGRQTAWLGWSHRDHAYPRIRGFRVAAELIGRYVSETGVAQDGLIYPFVYMWCQHLELLLKELIVDTEVLEEIEAKRPFGHDLMELWERLRRALGSRASGTEFDNVEDVIAEMHAVDPRGEAFRYPTSRDGTPMLQTVEQLSFERVGTALSAVANLLDAAQMQISYELEAKTDAIAEQLSWS